MITTLFTDASWCPKTRAGGWAAWVKSDSGTFKRSGRLSKDVTNSYFAELMAFVNGCYFAVSSVPDTTLLVAQTDCTTIMHRIKEKKKLKPFEQHAYAILDNRLEGVRLSVRHVKAHTSNTDPRSYINNWCDINAKLHMRSLRREKGLKR